MRNGVITFAILLSSVLTGKTQPNGGFENWTTEFSYEVPDGWQTLNFLALASPPNPISAFKAIGIDKHSGNYALKMKTVYVNNNPAPGQFHDTMGGVYTGKLNFSPFSYIYGYPYSGRPEKIEFWSKYYPIGTDTARASLMLTKWNGVSRDTIAACGINIPATNIYSFFQDSLIYSSLELPDSALIVFLSSKRAGIARVGSTLFIDDVAFTGWVGIDEQKSNAGKVNIFPNPATGDLNIQMQIEKAENVRIFDSSGKLEGIYKILNNNVSINTSLFAAGIYFYDITDKSDRMLGKGKFNVIK